ncbi:hypothetical protein [Streptomyces mexicanus]|uniref:hypothetical protein n=1 Tax=Streptomyces mexicanus TaxID=178566 RepID=UPI0031F04B6C
MKIETRCGRSIEVTRFAPQGLPASMGRGVLETPCTARDKGGLTAQAPALPEGRPAALRAVVSHCTVSHTSARPPEIHLRVVCEALCLSATPHRPGSVS